MPESGVLARRNLKPFARLSTRGEGFARARSLDLLRDAPSRAPRLRSGYRAPARIFRSRFSPERRVRPNSATHVIKDEHPCSVWLPPGWRARVSRRAASFALQRQQSSLWPAFPAAAGERYRFAHARIQGRPLASRHLLRFDRTRGAGTVSTQPIEIASTDCHVEWQRLSRSKTPFIDKEPGRLFTLAVILFWEDWHERSRRSFAHCGFTAPG